MSGFSLEDLDRHIANLQAQLQFLKQGLDATDHNAPDRLATDLISLRNKSGRLHDDMKRFRDQVLEGGLEVKKTKTTNKRLSIEGAKSSASPVHTRNHSKAPKQAISPPIDQSPTPRGKPATAENTYVVEHIDVTEEVNRRLQESRLRRLMETPSTSHKRKRDALDETRSESAAETEEDGQSRTGYSGSEIEGTPTKRLKSSGFFEQMLKRKDDGRANANGVGEERFPDREDFKRRRM